MTERTAHRLIATVGCLTVLLLGASLFAAVPQETPPRAVPFQDVESPMVSDSLFKRALDSLRTAVANGPRRYCASRSASTYMRTSCVQLEAVLRSMDALHATRFVLKREGPVLWPPAYANDSNPNFARPNPGRDTLFEIGPDTVTACGKVHYWNHGELLVFPPIRLRKITRWEREGIVQDSATWGTRGGNPLWIMCARSYPNVSPRDSIPVTWVGVWSPVVTDSLGRKTRYFRPGYELPTWAYTLTPISR